MDQISEVIKKYKLRVIKCHKDAKYNDLIWSTIL